MIHVFLGPSLPLVEARRILDARYLPPVAAGDVQALFEGAGPKPTAIAIIDGYFQTKPAVFHKEILFALTSGVTVYGASSMGALRAAELHELGMIGVGAVVDAYRSGALEDDDEVAVVHGSASEGYAALSDAMVNLRVGLERARSAGAIRAETAQALEREAKAVFYPERSWRYLFGRGRQIGIPPAEVEALRGFVAAHRPDAKREDAIALLERLARTDVHPPPPAGARFSASTRWRDLQRAVQTANGYGGSLSDGPPPAVIAAYARLFVDPTRSALAEAFVRSLVEEESARLGGARCASVADLLARSPEARARAEACLPEVLAERGIREDVVATVGEAWVAHGLRGAADDVSSTAPARTADARRRDEADLLAVYTRLTGNEAAGIDALAEVFHLAPHEVDLVLRLARARFDHTRTPRTASCA